jgi:hypothetical protein
MYRGLPAAVGLAVGADEGLRVRELVDDQVALRTLDDTLDLLVLVARDDGKAVVFLPHVRVLGDRHRDKRLAVGTAALATKVERVVVGKDLEPLADLFDPLVDLAEQSFVPCGALFPGVHGGILDP